MSVLTPSAQRLQDALEEIGVPSFRALQKEAIVSLCQGHDVFVVVATGGGKSLMYQLPALVTQKSVIVVSPLLALAKDQVDSWNDKGASVPACAYNCNVSFDQKKRICKDMACGEPMILYTTPESLSADEDLQNSIMEGVKADALCCVAIDEAHCVSQWGHDFRPAYLQLKLMRGNSGKACFGSLPFAALTATCTTEVKTDIVDALGLRAPKMLQHTFNRHNLAYSVRFKDGMAHSKDELDTDQIIPSVVKEIADIVAEKQGCSGIIYARKRDMCEGLASALNSILSEAPYDAMGVDVAHYHAGLSQSDRQRIQMQWQDGSIVAVVATVAFGMGIDKSDIRWVVHYNVPSSLEGFSQESGRAGRDGQPSESVLYVSQADLEWSVKVCKGHERAKMAAMVEYATECKCRRRRMLSYFGERRGPCIPGEDNLCDVCRDAKGVSQRQRYAEERREQLLSATDESADAENDDPAGSSSLTALDSVHIPRGLNMSACRHRVATNPANRPRQHTPCTWHKVSDQLTANGPAYAHRAFSCITSAICERSPALSAVPVCLPNVAQTCAAGPPGQSVEGACSNHADEVSECTTGAPESSLHVGEPGTLTPQLTHRHRRPLLPKRRTVQGGGSGFRVPRAAERPTTSPEVPRPSVNTDAQPSPGLTEGQSRQNACGVDTQTLRATSQHATRKNVFVPPRAKRKIEN